MPIVEAASAFETTGAADSTGTAIFDFLPPLTALITAVFFAADFFGLASLPILTSSLSPAKAKGLTSSLIETFFAFLAGFNFSPSTFSSALRFLVSLEGSASLVTLESEDWVTFFSFLTSLAT
jgi:hypothetical protein